MTTDKPAGTVKQGAAGVFYTFLKLGFTSFGGPVAHLGYFRKELVERRGWVSDSQFGQLLAICQFLPGPASSQLGFVLGLLRGGWPGALAAFLGFTLPSALLLLLFAALLPYLSGPIGLAAIHGLKLVACAVVADAVLGMFLKLCPDLPRRIIAVAAAGLLLLAGSAWLQLLVVLGGALAGLALCRTAAEERSDLIHPGYGKRFALTLLGVFAVLLLLFLALPAERGLFALAEAFYSAGALVFGGGHVVLPLLEESVVASGWVAQESFLAGYGASQAIPGPMFAFSAYLGALVPTGFPAWLGGAVALVFIFLPGFLLVAAVLPLWQAISRYRPTANAIVGVNAAVVGLLGAAFYDPILTSGIASVADLAVAVSAFLMLRYAHLSPLIIVVWCVSGGLLTSLL